MDKRKVWREQEQRLLERWSAAAERYRDAQAEVSRQQLSHGDAATTEAVMRVKTAHAELEFLRKQVARIKVEYRQGNRY